MSSLTPYSSTETEELQLFVRDVKQEIDSFWCNILDEFNTFSNDISNKLGKMEIEYDEYRQKYGLSDDDKKKQYINNHHRSSLEYKKRNKYEEKRNNDDSDYHFKHKKQYKKYVQNGGNTSMGHSRSLSTMEIPPSFKLDRIEESILIIKPRAATTHCKDIYTTLLDENFYVTDFEEGTASAQYFENLWAKKYGYLGYFRELCQEMATDTFLVLKVFRVNAINELIDLCGHDDPEKAYQENQNSLRAMFGQTVIQNAVYPAKNIQEVEQFNSDFFNNSYNSYNNNNNNNKHKPKHQSLLVIKPNAAQQFGDVIRAHLIGQKFEIIQQKVFNLNAFVYTNMIYDAPKQYIPEIIEYMSSGAVIALIVEKENVYEELQRVVGDRDPDIAAQQQPESIRANYGENIIKNAVEFAANYEIYKKNIPTFFFDVDIMNQAMEEQEEEEEDEEDDDDDDSDDSDEEILELPEDNKQSGYAIVIIKPHVSSYQVELIQDIFADHDICVHKQKSLNMPHESIKEILYVEYRNSKIIELMAKQLACDEILIWLVSSKINDNIFNVLSNIVPSIRDRFGKDEIRDVMHYTTTNDNFKAIADEFFFEFGVPTPPKTPNINLKLKSMDQVNKGNVINGSGTSLHQRRGTEVKPFISQFQKEQKAILLIKPHITKNQIFQIRKMLHDASIEVIKEKAMTLSIDILYNAFEMDGYDDNDYHTMCQYIASQQFIIWMVQRENVYEQLRYVIGPEDPTQAKQKYPQSVRAYYGLDKIRNAVYFTPNEHIYNHQIGIFFFEEHDEKEDAAEIPNVPSVQSKQNQFDQLDYINNRLNQYAQKQEEEEEEEEEEEHEDEYALVLLSSAITSNESILNQIKSRITTNKFVVLDQLSRYLTPDMISSMFNDEYSTFPNNDSYKQQLLDTFSNGEVLALHICRQNGYLLLQQLRMELEKHNLTTSMYITLSNKDYQSKCSHFFDSADDDDEKSENKQLSQQQQTNTISSFDNNQRAIIIFKPNITMEQKQDIRRMLMNEMLHVFDETETYIPRKTLCDLLSSEGYDEYYMDQICEYMAGHNLEAWLVKGENVYKELMLIVGPEDSDIARIQAPNSIRAKYGINKIQNVLYFTRNKDRFDETHRYFFFDEPVSVNSHDKENNNNNYKDNASSISSSTTSYSHSSRRKKPHRTLQEQLDSFQTRSKTTNHHPPLNESDEEQRAIIILQHHLKTSEIDSIRVILDNNDIDIIQEKTKYLSIDTYCTIFEKSEPNWNSNKINTLSQYYAKDECIAFLVAKRNVYHLLNKIIGHNNPMLAKQGTIRQSFGMDEIKNSCFFTKNQNVYKAIVDELFFEETPTKTPRNNRKIFNKQESINTSSNMSEQEKLILVIKPHIKGEQIDKIESMIYNVGLNIIQQKTSYLPRDVWNSCMKEEVVDDAHLAIEAQHLSSGAVTTYLIVGDNAFDKIADLSGPSEPSVAKLHMPHSIRAIFGIDEVRNCVWWTKNRKTYKRILHKFFFSEDVGPAQTSSINNQYTSDDHEEVYSQNSFQLSPSKYRSTTPSISSSVATTDKTLMVIKPHISISDRNKIKNILISNGIVIIQEKETHLAKESCNYLLKAEGYNQEYIDILSTELNRGELCALLLSKEGIFNELKEIVGPTDPFLAKKTAPNSIRALFGRDQVRNCVYWTKSKRHYKKIFSMFFFEDVSERNVDEADMSNSALLQQADGMSIDENEANDVLMGLGGGSGASSSPTSISEYDTQSMTSYGLHSHHYYNNMAPSAIIIIKPHAMDKQYEIEQLMESHDLEILAKRAAVIHPEAIYGFLKSNKLQSLNKQIMDLIVKDMCNGQVCVYCLGDKNNPTFNSVEKGLINIQEIAKLISKKYGFDQIRNAVYVSRDIMEMRRQRKFFFLDSIFFKHESNDDSHQYSFMIIKPNAFKYRLKIIQLLKSKEFHIVVNKKMNNIDTSTAKQFFEPYYKSDIDYDEYCKSMTNGSFVIIMVSRRGNCINALRQFTEQIQSMYCSNDGDNIIDQAVYTSSCESDFWRDRSFFFFHDIENVQFQDYGSDVSSIHSMKKKKKKKNIKIKNNKTISFELNAIEETILLIKPHATKYARDIEKYLLDKGFFIGKSRPLNMPRFVWADFYRKHENQPWFDNLCETMAEDQIISYILYRVNAIDHLRKLVGPTDPNKARISAPNSLRAIYGLDIIRNGFHCSHNQHTVIKERSELFFEDTDASWNGMGGNNNNDKHDRIFVIIKPNAAKLYGDNIRTHLVGNGFEIVKEKVVHFNETIYMNLSLDINNQYFDNSIKYLSSDQLIVMIVEKINGYEDIIEIIGHRDPNIALQQEPDSIRAIYGKNIIQNAIDVTLNKQDYIQNKEVFFVDDDDDDNKSRNRNKKQQQYQQQKEKILLVIKPHITPSNINNIKQILIRSEFEILSERQTNLPYNDFVAAFENDEDANIFDTICHEWSSGEITIFILSKINAFQTIKTIVGCDDPEIARSEAPSSIRATFGHDRIRNCCWYSQNIQQYQQKLQYFDF